MKKILSTMFVALAMLTAASCGKDDDKNGNGGGGSTTDLVGTSWYAVDGNLQSGNYKAYGLQFVRQDFCGYAEVTAVNGEETEDAYLGSYTYSNGSGTINFRDTTYTVDRGSATFTVNGDKLTLVFNGKTIELTKISGDFPGGGGDDPDDPDDPTPSYELDGRYWNYTEGNPDADEPETVTYYNVVCAQGYMTYTVRVEDPDAEESEDATYFGTYSYSNGSGSAAMKDTETMADAGTATFTVNGATMTFTFQNKTITLEELR